MKPRVVFVLMVLLLLPITFSAGSGGGGSTSSSSTVNQCPQDTWVCTSWSACQKDGTQARTCKLAENCNRGTPKPVETASCTYVSELVASLKCMNLQTLKQRVDCRLGLNDSDLRTELQIAYLPEECRALYDPDEKDACIKLYSDSQPCWKLPQGEQRRDCLRHILNILDIEKHKQYCGQGAACLIDLRRKVYALIKFSFYDLEERTEDLYKDGKITRQQAVEIISQLEVEKMNFNQATSKQQRQQIIKGTKDIWRDFAGHIKSG